MEFKHGAEVERKEEAEQRFSFLSFFFHNHILLYWIKYHLNNTASSLILFQWVGLFVPFDRAIRL